MLVWCPGEHSLEHAEVRPSASLNLPTAQSVHSSDPVYRSYEPAAQSMQSVMYSAGANLPLAHFGQLLSRPSSSEAVPAEHGEHSSDPVPVSKWPSGHGSHWGIPCSGA